VQRAPFARGHGMAVVIRKEDRLIGGCNITQSDNPDNREAWIGYCLNRAYWGQGYGTEVARALASFGFDEMGLHRIFATCDPRNVASRRVLEKAGMQLEGILREHKWQRGEWRDSCLYAVLEREWRAQSEAAHDDG
jgi:RimJ/RimL family protein N-acetyltransferase